MRITGWNQQIATMRPLFLLETMRLAASLQARPHARCRTLDHFGPNDCSPGKGEPCSPSKPEQDSLNLSERTFAPMCRPCRCDLILSTDTV
jgi:hypothetical protein